MKVELKKPNFTEENSNEEVTAYAECGNSCGTDCGGNCGGTCGIKE